LIDLAYPLGDEYTRTIGRITPLAS